MPVESIQLRVGRVTEAGFVVSGYRVNQDLSSCGEEVSFRVRAEDKLGLTLLALSWPRRPTPVQHGQAP